MKKSPLSPQPGKPRTWLITALLAAAAVAYVVFIFLPLQKSIRQLSSDLQEKRQQVVQAQGLTRPITQAKQRLVDTRNVCLQWKEAAPSPGELAAHFASLTQQAQDAGIAIERFDPQLAAELHILSQHNVTMQIRGEFAHVFDFLGRLERLPAAVWFRDVRLTMNEQPSQTLQGELTLTIFVDRTDYAN